MQYDGEKLNMEKERCLRLAVNANAKVWMDIWKHIRNKGNLLLEGSLNHACRKGVHHCEVYFISTFKSCLEDMGFLQNVSKEYPGETFS